MIFEGPETIRGMRGKSSSRVGRGAEGKQEPGRKLCPASQWLVPAFFTKASCARSRTGIVLQERQVPGEVGFFLVTRFRT